MGIQGLNQTIKDNTKLRRGKQLFRRNGQPNWQKEVYKNKNEVEKSPSQPRINSSISKNTSPIIYKRRKRNLLKLLWDILK